MSIDPSVIIESLAILFGTGGVAASVVALVKVQPETTRVIIASAKGAVVVQREVIDGLNLELERVTTALATERRECDERLEAQDLRIEAQDQKIDAQDRQIGELLDRIKELERRT